jgi:pimeloyl-ACP methyl ester carboxylesterase
MATETSVVTEKFVDLSHGKTRYFEAGTGYPLILVHGAGFLGGAEGWLHIMPTLAQKHHVYAIDCLNFGPSDVFDQEFSFAYLVDHVREFMDAMDIEKCNLAGHSMGGWIGTLFAYESPERLNKVVLSAAGGTATRPLQNMVEWKPPTTEQVTNQFQRRIETLPPDLGIEGQHLLDEALAAATNQEHTDAFAKVMRHMTNPMTRNRYNTMRRLAHIKTPALIIWGTADKTNDISMGHDLHAGIKGSQMVTLEGAGHGTPQERPEEWTKAVMDFLG